MTPTVGPAIVEVTARFAGAVVAMRRIGVAPRSTRPLAVGVALVGVGVVLAVAEVAARGTAITLPVHGVLFGVALVLVGLVAASVGWQRRADPDATAFWLGQRSDVDLTMLVPGLSADQRLAVVRRNVTGIELRFVPGMRGALVRDGTPTTLEVLAAEAPARADADGSFGVPFADAERAVIACGDITLEVQPAEGVPSADRHRLFDARIAVATFMAAVIVGGTIVLAHHIVPEAEILLDEEDRPAVYTEPARHPGTFVYPPRDRQ